MTFIWPTMLFALLLIPLFVGGYLLYQRRRQRLIKKYGELGLGQGDGARRHIPPTIFLMGLSVLLFSLSRPQAVVTLPKLEGTVILSFDASGSMAATDLKPTRMEAAKTAVKDFIKRQPPYVQIGVVAFSDSGFSMQVPSEDQGAVLAAIQRLAPLRGTSLANGILASLNAIAVAQGHNPIGVTAGEPPSLSLNTPMPTPSPTPVPQGTYTNAVIILLSDGENNENPDPLVAAKQAADRGVRIYTVGIGSVTGTDVHVNGFIVHTQLNEDLLKQISQITGGAYYNAQSEQDLETIYQKLAAQLVNKPEKTELTALFAGAAILVLLIGGTFSLLWFSRLP